MQKLKTKEFWLAAFAFLVGLLGVGLVVMQVYRRSQIVVRFGGQVQSYTKDATPTALALLTYFTNITLLLFSIFAILRFVAVLFNIKKLEAALNNRYVLSFLAINQLVVFVVYAALIVFVPLPKHKMTPYNLHQKWSSVFKHFFITIFSAFYCFSILKNEPKRVEIKKCLLFILYPLIYYIIVQIIGRTCYEYNWFPYPFFTTDQIWLTVFHTLKNFNFAGAFLLLVTCCALVLLIYILIVVLCCAISEKLRRGRRNRMAREVLCAKTEN